MYSPCMVQGGQSVQGVQGVQGMQAVTVDGQEALFIPASVNQVHLYLILKYLDENQSSYRFAPF